MSSSPILSPSPVPSIPSSVCPTVVLRNGVSMPSVALGLCFGTPPGSGYRGMVPEQSYSAIQLALDAGFQHFDGAVCYRTEKPLGAALAPLFRDEKIKRENVFITTKIGHPLVPPPLYLSESRTWNPRDIPATDKDIRKKILADLDMALDDLGVGYIDLLLIHWPGAFDETDEKFAREHRLRMWRVFEELNKKGVARAIGVANFSKKHLEELIADAEIIPMVNQIETSPYCHDTALINYCKEKKMIIEAYAPLASGCFGLFSDPTLIKIAKDKNRSTGQIILRWHLQHGHVVLPKALTAQQAKENLQLFDFELSDEQMKEIDSLHPTGQPATRTCPDPHSIV